MTRRIQRQHDDYATHSPWSNLKLGTDSFVTVRRHDGVEHSTANLYTRQEQTCWPTLMKKKIVIPPGHVNTTSILNVYGHYVFRSGFYTSLKPHYVCTQCGLIIIIFFLAVICFIAAKCGLLSLRMLVIIVCNTSAEHFFGSFFGRQIL